MEAKRISKKQCSIARQRAAKLISDVRKKLKDKYIFADRPVGSSRWGTMIEDEEGKYDLDYQLLLTKRSKKYKDNKLCCSTEIKNDFFNAFSEFAIKKEGETVQNSTTAITLVNQKSSKPYSIDFVIIRLFPTNNEIIRRNNKDETPETNEFTWNPLSKWNEAYKIFNELSPEEKRNLIEKIIIPHKAEEKKKNENDCNKISSAHLFVRDVNNYYESKK